MGTLRRRARHLIYLPPVTFWMVAVEVAVRCLPLPRTSRLLGVPLDATTEAPAETPDPLSLTRWQSGQLRALDPLARRWPFADGPCLRQALVAGHVLRRHHPVLRLGVTSGAEDFQAHAWVEVGGVLLGESSRYVPLINT